jgi:glycosyltransferase involved in cell wall biosynthesis
MNSLIQPKITIVTPSYNQADFIEATIKSVLNQTYKNIEFIIIDGGSTDGTMNIVYKYKKNISVIIHEKDKGQADAINKGFKLATGELVGWINSDDILYPTCIEELIHTYNNKRDGAIYYSNKLDFIDGSGKIFRTKNILIPSRDYLLNKDYVITQQGSFYPRQLLKKINYLNESIHYCMDLDLWLKLLNYGPIYSYTDKPAAAFRIWSESKTSTGGKMFLEDIRKVLLKHGAKRISPNIIKTYYYTFKLDIKHLLINK